MASTSLPLATAAAVATLFAAPAGAVPDQPTTPATPTPAPSQPGATDAPEDQGQPETTKPESEKPESDTPESDTPESTKPESTKPESTKPESGKPTPSQPGVTTPDPNQVMPNPLKDPKLASPTQPGVTTPRVAPLPVPGQQPGTVQPAVVPDPPVPGATPKPAQPDAQVAPGTPGENSNAQGAQPEADTLVQQPRWEAPRLQAAPAAPVVEMEGPHQEVGANIDGGTLIPGYVANTHHFNNAAGYVGTIGYRTPTGAGEAGVSVEYVGANSVKLTSYTGGEGLPDNKTDVVFDTTQANLAKAAVEHWIAAQPGGQAALDAAAQVKLPLPGELAQTANVAGVTTQWGGSLQY
ncbi:hypothetical protein [Nocardia australiensis]|uniref:hypothetical protein n=1 Tax=Nocardia australiensis TaxID=2887191 RepID=UPI001D1531D0|nr:hypothetical protein [Nocardia australiensis]